MNRKPSRRGFTLIELLIVVAIIGIIVAIMAFNLINAIERARQRRTMGDMHTVAVAIEQYSADTNRYPPASAYTLPSGLSLSSATATLGAISAYLQPTYVKSVPLADGWHSWMLYGTNETRSDYIIRSPGRDGILQGSPFYGPTTEFNADLILVDGSFVQWPQGIQQ